MLVPIKATTLDEIVANTKRQKAVYDRLTPGEREIVDAFNARIHGKSIREIIAAGEHPMKALMEKYGDVE